MSHFFSLFRPSNRANFINSTTNNINENIMYNRIPIIQYMFLSKLYNYAVLKKALSTANSAVQTSLSVSLSPSLSLSLPPLSLSLCLSLSLSLSLSWPFNRVIATLSLSLSLGPLTEWLQQNNIYEKICITKYQL